MITGIRVEHEIDRLGIFWNRKKGTNWYKKGFTIALNQKDLFTYTPDKIGGLEKRHEKMTCAHNIEGFTKEHLCAYSSVEYLHEFITNDELEKLIKLGFKVYRVSVSNAIIYEPQFLFLKDDIVEKNDITNDFL